MGMPKPKPDQVIRFEVVLGSVEREIARDIRTAYGVNKISTPMVALLSDVSAMYIVATIVELFGKDIPWLPTVADVPEGLEWLAEQAVDYNAYRSQAQATPPRESRPPPENAGSVLYNLMNPNWNFGDFSWSSVTGGIFD